MRTNTDLSFAELYAVERAARAARAREISRLVSAGLSALAKLARSAASGPVAGKEAYHA